MDIIKNVLAIVAYSFSIIATLIKVVKAINKWLKR